MPKPHAEHSSTIKAKKRKVVESDRVSPVSGGSVRRIVFEGEEPEPAPEPREVTRNEREWSPRHRASIEDIHFEVDNLHRTRRAQRSERTPRTHRERDVHPVTVDKVIASRLRRESAQRSTESVQEPKKRARPKKATKPKKTSTKKSTPKSSTKTSTKKTSAKATQPKTAAKAGAKSYQPQCAAVTKDAKQCRNSAKDGSKYCGAHRKYTPAKGAKILDTKPAKGTEDTKPGEKGSQATAQCAAYTKDGLQCKRTSRRNSKYCGIHKGYRRPTKADLENRLDTKPRHAKAKDTKPSV